ncbi:MAG: hypothetical protein NDI77_14330 [Geobacteraceae bacterium]|nr:hypothetical protein [Geobacteraceae bacterium]
MEQEELPLCSCRERHQGHICVLRGKGMASRIKELSCNPNVACFICGEEADSEDDVCSPAPLFV